MIDSKSESSQPMQQTMQAPPPQYAPNGSTTGSGSYPPQNPPQNISMPAPAQAPVTQRSPAQIGEEYRAALFAQCAQGVHDPKTKYGPCGIITAIMCFPCGLICLFADTEQTCARCGVKLSK